MSCTAGQLGILESRRSNYCLGPELPQLPFTTQAPRFARDCLHAIVKLQRFSSWFHFSILLNLSKWQVSCWLHLRALTHESNTKNGGVVMCVEPNPRQPCTGGLLGLSCASSPTSVGFSKTLFILPLYPSDRGGWGAPRPGWGWGLRGIPGCLGDSLDFLGC